MTTVLKDYITANTNLKKSRTALQDQQFSIIEERQNVEKHYWSFGELIFSFLSNFHTQGFSTPLYITDICDTESLNASNKERLIYKIEVTSTLNQSVLLTKLIDYFATHFNQTPQEIKKLFHIKIYGNNLIIKYIKPV